MRHPDIAFALDNKRAGPKLLKLIDWLESEAVRVRVELDKIHDEKPAKNTLGRPIATEVTAKRDRLKHQLDVIADDIQSARVWLIECEVNQEWRVGLEVARWINRPTLAQSSEG